MAIAVPGFRLRLRAGLILAVTFAKIIVAAIDGLPLARPWNTPDSGDEEHLPTGSRAQNGRICVSVNHLPGRF